MSCRVVAAVIVIALPSLGCRGTPTEAPRTSSQSAALDEVERNKAVVRRWVDEAHNKRNLSVVDDIYTADYRGHTSGGDSFDIEQGRKMEQTFQADFPTHNVSIDDLLGETRSRSLEVDVVSNAQIGKERGSPRHDALAICEREDR